MGLLKGGLFLCQKRKNEERKPHQMEIRPFPPLKNKQAKVCSVKITSLQTPHPFTSSLITPYMIPFTVNQSTNQSTDNIISNVGVIHDI
jgi:hypothetical protein